MDRKKAEYRIMKGANWKWMFTDINCVKGGANYYSYRNLLVNVLFHQLKKDKSEHQDIINKFKSDLEALIIRVKNKNFIENDYNLFDLIQAQGKDYLFFADKGKNKDIFPIKINISNDKKQIEALIASLKNIINSIEQIRHVLLKYKKWNKKIQNLMEKYYEYSK